MATELTSAAKLRRFCFLGTFDPVYIYKKNDIEVESLFPSLSAVCKEVNDEELSHILAETLGLPTLIRRNEPIFVYAVYLATEMDENHKTAARKFFAALIQTDEDLFLFCKYTREIQELRGQKKFSRTIKKAIKSWYDHQSPEVLESLFEAHSSGYGFTHKSLLRMCHVNDETIGDHSTVAPLFKKAKTEEKTKDGEEEKGEEVKKYASPVIAINKLRTTTDPAKALQIIEAYNLDSTQVPKRFFKHSVILEKLIKSMSGVELLSVGRRICLHQHHNNKTILRHYQARLKKEKSSKQLHPVRILYELRKLHSNQKLFREEDVVQKCKNIDKLGLAEIFNESFGKSEPLGLRLHITVNMQEDYKLKPLHNAKNICYMEAALSIAFGYFMQEKNADVFHFTENLQLAKLPWNKEMSYAKVLESNCFNVKKHKQNNISPLMHALKCDQPYDVFLVIARTAGRSNPQHSSEFLCKVLDKYREVKNPNARYIILDLVKYKKSMRYSTSRCENILEICGFDGNTIDLIKNFALKRFA